MTDRASPTTHPIAALLAALALAACAGSGAHPEEEPAREGAERDSQRSVLEVTTPAAAAAHANPPPGAAQAPSDPADPARPGRLLIYSAITGHVPLKDQPALGASNRHRSPAEREAARARTIEAEIEQEIERQEKLTTEEDARGPVPPAPTHSSPELEESANPLTAPQAPELREVPDTLFRSQEVTIPPGRWQNKRELRVLRQTMDIDRDGRPEEIRYVDPGSGVLIRSEHDLDYDGEFDAWTSYEGGEPAVRVLDTNGDGKSDVWERYAQGRMNARTLDRDGDGVKDTFYRYEGDQLAEKLHDSNNDGTIDKVEAYHNRHRVRTEEDRSLNGWMDTWTTYHVVDGREVVAKIERDSRDHGKPDVFETYETSEGETRILRKEEDTNGDGEIDIISTYENGKLVQRAISDEALSPL
ncbi:MAG: VCBS repeat-containing protein [Deltaproteobacteria bacterium]|nr:VCBS repeat-containing protein [Deltaproteobacteria bacterium]